jgi:transcription-repair coupling factor (superfamily II helicase)
LKNWKPTWTGCATKNGRTFPLSDLYETPDDLVSSWEGRTLLEISGLAFHDSVEAREVRFRVDTNQDLRALMGASRGEGLLAPLAARIKSWRTQNHDVVLACHTKEQARRLMELFQDYQLYPELETAGLISLTREDRRFRIVVGFLSQGFTIPALGAAFVTEDELFGPKRRVVRRAVEEVKGIHLSSFQDLGMGDYVVHTDHGIGQYLGLVKLDAGGRPMTTCIWPIEAGTSCTSRWTGSTPLPSMWAATTVRLPWTNWAAPPGSASRRGSRPPSGRWPRS